MWSDNWGPKWLSGRPYKAAHGRSFTVKEPPCVLRSLTVTELFFNGLLLPRNHEKLDKKEDIKDHRISNTKLKKCYFVSGKFW